MADPEHVFVHEDDTICHRRKGKWTKKATGKVCKLDHPVPPDDTYIQPLN